MQQVKQLISHCNLISTPKHAAVNMHNAREDHKSSVKQKVKCEWPLSKAMANLPFDNSC